MPVNEIIKQYKELEQEEQAQIYSNSQYCSYLYKQYLDYFSRVESKEDITWKINIAVKQTVLGSSYPLYLFHQMIHVNENVKDEIKILQQAGIKNLHFQFPIIYFQYQDQEYKITNLFSTPLSKQLKEKLYEDVYMKPRNCHKLTMEIAKEIKGEVYTGYLQFPTMNMLHSWCVKDGFVYDTMYDLVLTQELYEIIFEPVNVIAFSFDHIYSDEIEVENITMPYPVYLYCDYKNTMKQK